MTPPPPGHLPGVIHHDSFVPALSAAVILFLDGEAAR
jgi:hypothetical protein